MATLLKLSVPGIVTDIATYNRLQVGRATNEADATARTGTWELIEDQALISNVSTYEYTDASGSSVHWYSYRLNHSGTNTSGSFSTPEVGRVYGYISVGEFKEYEIGDLFNPDGTEVSDSKIRQMVKMASSMIDSFVGYSFDHRRSTEKHRWDQRTRRIYPIHKGIRSVDSVRIHVSAMQSAAFTVNDIFINDDRGYVEITSLANVTYSLFPAIVALGMIEPVAEITYTHGNNTPPQDIKDATALIVVDLLAKDSLAKQGMQGISRLRVGEMEIYADPASVGPARVPLAAIPQAAILMLDPYVRTSIR
ncbi:hypothetical protein UFOVP1131_48 [uncultured Caudovirales phage]|uniref:Uncharacterized protein n=1 Tax=uncultured Caudovirales phage TaxID=2100421 RepID=A0A6J5PTV0_9CAUD|nr:hypothetical protein UFOVP966_62 [uncultured Caudovirales phage]CAB4184921.1 hypothetical protein UFOVP1131_48 [uncultured Caudovirales phage]CAB4192318.1 hypothetical protein UFOVP1245_14 [uncultured Caudovirales phage]CAB5231207.1 hypothetical protein UFOVP1582_40 [uncultured Caudovirales phage]